MAYRVTYQSESAPKVGAFFNAIGAFSERGKQRTESQFIKLFDDFKRDGVISADSILKRERIFGPHEAQRIAGEFAREQVNAIIMLDSAFPNGHVLSTIAGNPYLAKIPLIVTADSEAVFEGDREWTTNAWCGVIMNNYAARHMGRYVKVLPGCPDDETYREELKMFLNVYHTLARMRDDYMGRFGDAPGGFHSATTDELALTMLFGTRIDTIDLMQVMHVYESMAAKGLKGEVKFSERDVEETEKRLKKGRICLVDEEMLKAGARLYHTFRAIIEANGFTSACFRCWPEFQSDLFAYTPCLAMGLLLADGLVTGAGCESDCLVTVAQSLGTCISGEPAALLDFVNYTGGSDIVQLGHCGCGIPGSMAANDCSLMEAVSGNGGKVTDELKEKIFKGEVPINDAISLSSPPKQCGFVTGPNLVGQFKYGVKTGIDLIHTRNGKYKMLVFTGSSDETTVRNILYTAADVRVKDHGKLSELIIEHGFSHHLAMAMTDISRELKVLCEYYGIEYVNPDEQ